MSSRDDLVQAATFAAFALRNSGSAEYLAAVERVVDAHVLWPLIEYEHALERARAIEQERLCEEAELLAWYEQIPTVGNIERRPRPASTPESRAALIADAIEIVRESFLPARAVAA